MASRSKAFVAYRIADARYPIFDGTGAMLLGGRWNSPGRPAIYASASYAGAMLELLVHAGTGHIPKHQRVVRLTVPARIRAEQWSHGRLPVGWSAPDCIVSRAIGDRWLDRRHSAILIVPSVVAKYETNVVINPAHPDVKAIVASPPEDVLWDMRLFTK